MIQTSVAEQASVFIVMALVIAPLVVAGLLAAVARILNLLNTPINGMFLAAVEIPQRASGAAVAYKPWLVLRRRAGRKRLALRPLYSRTQS